MASLLEEMIDRTAVTRLPEPAYRAGQASSYDRRSDPDKGDFWFANADRTQFVRYEDTPRGTEWVMMDERGPGAIVRWWMTFAGENSGQGTLRIYLDGAEEPTVEGSAFDVVSGHLLVGPPLSTSVSQRTEYNRRGHNLYLPIPYAESVKITYQSDNIDKRDTYDRLGKKEAVYYNINFRTYGDGAQVRSFTREGIEEARTEILGTRLALSQPFETAGNTDELSASVARRKIRPGESLSLSVDGGRRMISSFSLELDAPDIHRALRGTLVEFEFDGRRTLRCPVGDFFGTGYRLSPYETYYSRVLPDGRMSVHWPMPFRDSARLTLRNLGEAAVTVSKLELRTADYEWDEARSMHFAGNWQQFYQRQTGAGEDPEDLTFAHIEGQGVYVGDAVALYNDADAWWGEGDEKVYIDGADFPSHFGTGTEDYYGYAWSRPEIFDHPFIAQPDGRGNLAKGTAVNLRWRGLDAIPFSTGLRVDVELWHWARTTVDYAPVSFYYLRPGAASRLGLDERELTRPLRFAPRKEEAAALSDGRIEGEHLEVARVDRGRAAPQSWEAWGWSGGTQLWWRQARPGDTLELDFISDAAYRAADLLLHLTTASDYGRVSISLNDGQPTELDNYSADGSTRTVRLKGVDVKRGTNTVRVSIIGTNPEARPAYMFGLDYLSVEP